MDEFEFEKFVDFHKRWMVQSFETQGEFHLVGIVLVTRSPEGEPLPNPPMAAMIVNFEDKQQLADAMRDVAKKMGGIGTVVCSEVWMAQAKSEEDAQRIARESCEAQPNRTEHLMIHGEIGGTVFGYSAPITRDAAGKPTLGEWKQMEGKVSGHFTGLVDTN